MNTETNEGDFTPEESKTLIALLEKLSSYDDMAYMDITNKAQELLDLINEQ